MENCKLLWITVHRVPLIHARPNWNSAIDTADDNRLWQCVLWWKLCIGHTLSWIQITHKLYLIHPTGYVHHLKGAQRVVLEVITNHHNQCLKWQVCFIGTYKHVKWSNICSAPSSPGKLHTHTHKCEGVAPLTWIEIVLCTMYQIWCIIICLISIYVLQSVLQLLKIFFRTVCWVPLSSSCLFWSGALNDMFSSMSVLIRGTQWSVLINVWADQGHSKICFHQCLFWSGAFNDLFWSMSVLIRGTH